MTTFTRTTLQALGLRVAESGVDVDPQALSALVDTARATEVSPVLIEVLTDETAPSNVRMRAFEKVSCYVARAVYTPTRASVAIAA